MNSISTAASATVFRVLSALSVVAAPGALAANEAAGALAQLREASAANEHAKALQLGEAFVAAHSDHPEIAAALHLTADAGMECSNFARAASLYRKIVKEHPDYKAIGEARFGLAHSLAGLRALEECIQQCRENLELAPDDPGADYYRFLIPQSQFRLWRFDEAEKGLMDFVEKHPDSAYAAPARRHLEKINPSWTVDENGIAAYSGKYEDDYRFKAALEALPGYVEEGREMIRERLGVDIDFEKHVNFIFRDAGADSRGGIMAETFTISRDYQPVTVIQFYAEHAVIDPTGYRKTTIHELKHAGFKVRMGRGYDDLPDWIAEGLAQWAADELERRVGAKLTNETFAGKDPFSTMNGVANPAHDVGDYLEDVLAFEWLEEQKPGNVLTFSRGLIEGESWQKLLAATSGLDADEAIRQMDSHCRERVADELGRFGRRAVKLRDTYYAKASQGAIAANEWLREEGNRQFAEWAERYPEHVLAPVIRFYAGRGLIMTGSLAKGRKWLRGIIDGEGEHSLRDDALFWEGYAFQQEKRFDDAARSFRILLRDYSWSNNAPKVRGKFEPAGPELEAPSPPRGDR